jgi:hypothetical protein
VILLFYFNYLTFYILKQQIDFFVRKWRDKGGGGIYNTFELALNTGGRELGCYEILVGPIYIIIDKIWEG